MNGVVRYRLQHVTRYAYAAEVMISQHLLHLVPRPAPYQRCLDHSIEVTPAGHRVDGTDAFGNPIVRLEIDVPHTSLTVTSRMEVDVHARPRLPASESLPWERVADGFRYRAVPPGRDLLDAGRFRYESPHVHIKREYAEFAADCFAPGRPLLAAAEALMHKIHAEFRYEPGTTTIGTSVAEVRSIFDKAAAIDNIKSVNGKDIEVTKEGDKIVVSFAYQREIHLAGPAYLTLKYAGRSK